MSYYFWRAVLKVYQRGFFPACFKIPNRIETKFVEIPGMKTEVDYRNFRENRLAAPGGFKRQARPVMPI